VLAAAIVALEGCGEPEVPEARLHAVTAVARQVSAPSFVMRRVGGYLAAASFAWGVAPRLDLGVDWWTCDLHVRHDHPMSKNEGATPVDARATFAPTFR
jgi:hypothetical protein